MLKNHWFCKVFGPPEGGRVENHWFCNVFGPPEGGCVEKPFGFVKF